MTLSELIDKTNPFIKPIINIEDILLFNSAKIIIFFKLFPNVEKKLIMNEICSFLFIDGFQCLVKPERLQNKNLKFRLYDLRK